MLVCRVQAPSLGCRGRGTGKRGPVCRKEAVDRVQLCDDLCPQVGICHDMQWVHTAQPLRPSTLASVPMGRAVNCFERRPWGCGIVEVMRSAQVTPALTIRERGRESVRGWSPTPWTTLSWLFCSGAASFGQHPTWVPWTHVMAGLGPGTDSSASCPLFVDPGTPRSFTAAPWGTVTLQGLQWGCSCPSGR